MVPGDRCSAAPSLTSPFSQVESIKHRVSRHTWIVSVPDVGSIATATDKRMMVDTTILLNGCGRGVGMRRTNEQRTGPGG